MPNRREHQSVELTTPHSSSASTRDASSRQSKVAIVTGVSSGIGLEAVKRLVTNGYRIVANARRLTSAMTLSETPDVKLVDGDISHPETARQVVSTAVQEFGRIDLLLNFFYVSQLAVSRCAFRSPDMSLLSEPRW